MSREHIHTSKISGFTPNYLERYAGRMRHDIDVLSMTPHRPTCDFQKLTRDEMLIKHPEGMWYYTRWVDPRTQVKFRDQWSDYYDTTSVEISRSQKMLRAQGLEIHNIKKVMGRFVQIVEVRPADRHDWMRAPPPT